jgi:hypothetical protein
MHIDHIGWITNNILLFEEFWCKIVGYTCIWESELDSTISKALFNIDDVATIHRYTLTDTDTPDIEIHQFHKGSGNVGTWQFNRQGINHVCLHTGAKGSREEFLKVLPAYVIVHKYKNPKGWFNIFIQDFENNWVELREDF